MSRHTKIVATLGPASSDLHTLERMAHAGVDVVRMNFSHGKAEEHIARADAIRDASARTGRPIGILADLQGPKIRIGKLENGRITLTRDAPFVLDARCELGADAEEHRRLVHHDEPAGTPYRLGHGRGVERRDRAHPR